jgi:hypothetical protein
MLWLIWIAMMLIVPVAAGVHVWFQLHRAPAEGPATNSGSVSAELSSAQPHENQR